MSFPQTQIHILLFPFHPKLNLVLVHYAAMELIADLSGCILSVGGDYSLLVPLNNSINQI